MKSLAVGLMSGTSADGVSAVLVSFRDSGFKLIRYRTFSYPKKIQNQILNSIKLSTPEISSLNFKLGHFFSSCVSKLIHQSKVNPAKMAVIGSHGQTLFHEPAGKPPNTFQIGEPAVIAGQTGITVVSDFRTADIAAGGEGAPLIPFFDQTFFGKGIARAMQNIGGIANVTVVGKNIKPIAFDTGPGNCLIDWAVKKITRGRLSYDRGGRMAEKGTVQLRLIREMMRHPYFNRKPPKSTGRELFNENFLPHSLSMPGA